jgi:hypothetical protein
MMMMLLFIYKTKPIYCVKYNKTNLIHLFQHTSQLVAIHAKQTII